MNSDLLVSFFAVNRDENKKIFENQFKTHKP